MAAWQLQAALNSQGVTTLATHEAVLGWYEAQLGALIVRMCLHLRD